MKTTCAAPLPAAVLGTLLGTLLGGCYESPDVTWHEPGEYKGAADPLLEVQRSEAQQQRLRERFAQVQTDR